MSKEDYREKIGSGRDENRTHLYKVVPLAVPFSIGLSINDFCNFKCIYCYHSVPGGFKGPHMMSYDEYLEIADQIEEFYCANGGLRTKNLRICGYGEPLMNKDVTRIVAHARAHMLSDRIEITTNASMLTHELSEALIDAGLTRLLVSVQGITAEKYKSVCGFSINYPEFLEELSYFYEHRGKCKLYVKIVDAALDSPEEHDLFYEMFGNICDEMNIEHIINAADCVDYSDLLSAGEVMRYSYEYKERLVCDSLFSMLNIESNGDVSCCGCRYPSLPIGNMNTARLKDIWNGAQHTTYMMCHLQGKYREIPHCSNCSSMQYTCHPMDNLDEHRDEVLQRVQVLRKGK